MTKLIFQEPRCPEHGRLALDLARGRLSLDRAAGAEQTRRDCSVCHAWWQDHLVDGREAVESEVGEAFASFEAPRSVRARSGPARPGRVRYWLAAAAAFFALIVGLSVLERQTDLLAPEAGSRAARDEILAIDFETSGGAERGAIMVVGSSEEDIFSSNFESGQLVAWSPES